MSFITFCLLGLDKFNAKHRKPRIKERTIHLFELLGGWPGTLIGRPIFRHKTRKFSYSIELFLIAFAHCAIVSLLFYLFFL